MIPLLPIFLALATGIFLGAQLPPETPWLFIVPPLPLLTIVAWILLRKRHGAVLEYLFQGALLGTFAMVGMLMIQAAELRPGNHVEAWMGESVRVKALALEDSRETKFGQKVILECMSLDEGGAEIAGKVLVYLPEDAPLIRERELISIDLRFKPLKTKFEGYRRYLENKGIFLTANGRNISSHGLTNHPIAWGASLRRNLKGRILSLMPDPAIGGLAVAMLLGDKSLLATEFRESFAASGLSHILAISGLHVGIIFFFLQQLVGFLGRWRFGKRLQTLLCLLILLGYMVMTGCSPAVCRAVMMIGIVELGKLFFQRSKALNSLALAGLILVLIRPANIFEIGFQLSFCAVGGILVVAPKIQTWFKARFNWGKDSLVASASVCLAAQAFTAPLIWYHFGTFPTYFLVANLLLLPIVTFIVNLGFLGLTLIWIPYLNKVLFGMLDFALWSLTQLSQAISRWPGANIEKLSFSDTGFCILFAMVIFGLGFWQHQSLFRLWNRLARKESSLELTEL